MPDAPDLMQVQWDAVSATKDRLVEVDRRLKAETVMPAVGRKLSKDERAQDYRSLRRQPELILSKWDELVDRFPSGITERRPYPRALIDRLLLGERDIAEETDA